MLGKKIALGTANFGSSYGIFKSKISEEAKNQRNFRILPKII